MEEINKDIEQTPVSTPIIDVLHASTININTAKDKETREALVAEVDAWYQLLNKDIHNLFAKYGVKMYEIGFLHEGSKLPMIINNGELLDVTRLSALTTKELQAQVMERIKV